MKLIKNNSYLILVIVFCLMFTILNVNKAANEVAYEKVIVTEGDTLWGYSLLYANNVPTDKWIKEVINLNKLTSTTIEVGKELQIPRRQGLNENDVATNLAGDSE
ncbi:cell division suppressor protein YneA [Sporosarcina sp. G11-34]|uniref:cell division suppressor protein YneA n=1 Tax=Sporosarcina sp. G11-34 TaxID=2849605 RepID=UPI0022A98AEF|nr:LysM peptidoglycan-binding domain-containing protein [Sporosarcina sp. G11-34]MCZ2256981.1 LysM peptidoglycan-binding domain-containing protein [Sporosarcina sp. G11-34]